ncbi:hypothetical protein HDU83_003973 [Entophlyctis luteolus]|nr:hypothetical protein HDU83_003973 [Entophlyctis luteolus]KAJ3393244.1 hypothetical protein HDU84_002323 [Entophlyctis sp. JEL0112]
MVPDGPDVTLVIDETQTDCDLASLFGDCDGLVSEIRESIARVLSVLYDDRSEFPPVEVLVVHVCDFDGVADTSGSKTRKTLRLSSSYFTRARHGDRLEHEGGSLSLIALIHTVPVSAQGVIVHELVHVLQYDGSIVDDNATANGGFIEGLADYVRIKHDLAPPHWRRRSDPPEQGSAWDRGYEHTAYFLLYIEDTHAPFFSKRVNLLLRDLEWTDDFFQVAANATLGELWKSYLASFPSAPGVTELVFKFSNRAIHADSDTLSALKDAFPTPHHAVAALSEISATVFNTLYPATAPQTVLDRVPKLSSILLVLRNMTDSAVAHCTGTSNAKEIHLSVDYLRNIHRQSLSRNDSSVTHTLTREVRGILTHELVHAWQPSSLCRGVPAGLTEGIADFVRLSCGLAPPHWPRTPPQASSSSSDTRIRWDVGYAHTALFLRWIDTARPGFVVRLNALAAEMDVWDARRAFEGDDVEELWQNYCAAGVNS